VATPDELAESLAALDVTSLDPTLTSGELLVRSPTNGCARMLTPRLQVRQAGKTEPGECSIAPVKSFSALPINDLVKKAVARLGWQTMSKIQQIGLPLILSDPPMHLIGQAQAGTGKTGTFVLSALGRIDTQTRLSQPQAIIIAGTQELVSQIAEVVRELGKEMGVRARRIMSSTDRDQMNNHQQGGGGRGRGRGAPMSAAGQQRPANAAPSKAEWHMNPGEDFDEQIVVGTPGKIKGMLRDFERGRKPFINPGECRVLILDEVCLCVFVRVGSRCWVPQADNMVSEPPHGNLPDCIEIRNAVVRARVNKPLQVLLFSATFTDEARASARAFVGGDYKKYHEITLRREDLTLDKVDNFFVLVGKEGDSGEEIVRVKDEAICQIWESLAAEGESQGQTVIFVNSKQRAQRLAEYLRGRGFEVGQLHGDMEKMERERVFQEFKDNKRPALVATNILSRGIDNPNVTLVINVDLPERMGSKDPDPETFVHRIGRSGRWTRRGASISLVSPDPKVNDKRVMQAIERALFANEAVDRPLIQVAEPSLVGEAMRRRKAERLAQAKS
jgi:ATP-dependent RNA helicase DDX19/DBP5